MRQAGLQIVGIIYSYNLPLLTLIYSLLSLAKLRLKQNCFILFQVDVIESQWNILQSHIQNSHDFTELVGFHQE